jgi:hypothetical protein
MIGKFQHLRSSTDPYGLMEQLAVAITVDPLSDGTDSTGASLNFSWFGGLMANPFTWAYYDRVGTLQETADRPTFFRYYAARKVRFTAYEWEYTKIEKNSAAGTGVVEGTVWVKAKCELPAGAAQHDHLGEHSFLCEITINPNDNKWKVSKLTLKQK